MVSKLFKILRSFPSFVLFMTCLVIVLGGAFGALSMAKEFLEEPNLKLGLFILLPLLIMLTGWMGLRYIWDDGGKSPGSGGLLGAVESFARGGLQSRRGSAPDAQTAQRWTQDVHVIPTPPAPTPASTPDWTDQLRRRPSLLRRLDSLSPEGMLVVFGLFWHVFAALIWWRAGWDVFGVAIPGIIGSLAYWLAGYYYLQRFLPDAELNVSAETVTPGQSMVLTWSIEGRGVERIRRLTVLLKGKGEIREEPPKDSEATDEYWKTTWEKDFQWMMTLDPGTIARGRISVTIPDRLQPTFADHDRKVTWRMRLNGETSWYLPDLIRDRLITILPGSSHKP